VGPDVSIRGGPAPKQHVIQTKAMTVTDTDTDIPIVFIVDADEVSRRQVRAVVEEMGERSAEYPSAEDFLAAYDGQRPSCLIVEFRLLGMNGILLQQTLRRANESLPVVFVAAYPETRLTVQAMHDGAITVLEKPFSPQDLWDAIRTCLATEKPARPPTHQDAEFEKRLANFTEQEILVMRLLLQGKRIRAIAQQLQVSQRTVEQRRRRIFEELGFESVAVLARLILLAREVGDATEEF
jgi:FixJ family two-component response regulator